ncbi:uncharacterized protein LOC131635274 [Vicia villosa]|uniref:uncharacterized protein LOC131635274 n=1 Tax=Vicia villosa TaxID=3911 RepID=UPI00273B6329|nr:uncharacterized protein LOC131635274 [Vicia villosa]
MERRVIQMVVNKELMDVWNKLVPHKVSVLIWRIWQNKIPSRENLVKRGILPQSQVLCPYGCSCEENIAHIFFECPAAIVVWNEVYRWLGFWYVSHNSAVQNFMQFAGMSCGGRVNKERLMVIWFACIWTIWKQRNDKVFKTSEQSNRNGVEAIQILSWSWIKLKVVMFEGSTVVGMKEGVSAVNELKENSLQKVDGDGA